MYLYLKVVIRHACLTERFFVIENYQEFPFCHRKYLSVNCISFMQHDFLPVTQNYLWKKFPSCNKIFVPVTGTFLPLTGISYLLQEFHHRIFKMLRFPFGIFLFFFPSLTFILKCDINAWIFYQISCEILHISCGEYPCSRGENITLWFGWQILSQNTKCPRNLTGFRTIKGLMWYVFHIHSWTY